MAYGDNVNRNHHYGNGNDFIDVEKDHLDLNYSQWAVDPDFLNVNLNPVVYEDIPSIPKLVYEDPNIGIHNPKLSGIMSAMKQNDNRWFHIELIVGYGENQRGIHADPNILCQSLYFVNLFFEERRLVYHVGLFELDPEAVEIMLNFMYTGKLEIRPNVGIVQNVILVAEKFRFEGVSSVSLDYLTNQLIQTENCYGIFGFLKFQTKFNSYMGRIYVFMNKHLANISDKASFFNLSESEISTLISHRSYQMTPEASQIISKAILNWVAYDEGNRRSYCSQLLEKAKEPKPKIEANNTENKNSCDIPCIELGCSRSIPVRELGVVLHRLEVKRQRISASSPELKQKIIKSSSPRSRDNKNIPAVDDGLKTTPFLVPLDSSQFAKTIIYTDYTNERNYLFEYDFRVSIFTFYSHLSGNNLNNCLTYFIFRTRQTQTNKMIHEVIPRRKLASLAYFNNKIYDLGGTLSASIRDDECKSSTFLDIFHYGESRFAENLDHLPRLNEPKSAAAVCICQGSLYSIGGSQEDQHGPIVVNYVERLDLNERNSNLKWEETNYLNKERESHDVAVLDDKIFVIGGLGGGSQECLDGDLKSVELYDPRWETGDPDCDWEQLPDMHDRRPYVKVAVLNDKIYAVGGDAYIESMGGRQNLFSVEVFNPERLIWSKCCRMKHRRSRGILMVENNLLYAIGGNSRLKPSMEVYDYRIDKWMDFPWPIGLGTHDSEYAFGIVVDK